VTLPVSPAPAPGESQIVVKLPDEGKPAEAKAGEETAVPTDQLVERWMVLAKSATREKPNVEEGVLVVREIAKAGPAALGPLYDVLADKAASPFAKALASISLSVVFDAGQLPRVTALTKPENDLSTRLCATRLLGAIPGAEADAALTALATDPERQVRYQALRSLAARAPEGRKAFAELFSKPDTTTQEKSEIVSVLAGGTASDSIGVFEGALKDGTLDESIRVLAAQVLGRVGNESSLAPLTECRAKDPSENVQKAARSAIDALNSRLGKQQAAPSNK
jgi:HEAT repeat protein